MALLTLREISVQGGFELLTIGPMGKNLTTELTTLLPKAFLELLAKAPFYAFFRISVRETTTECVERFI